MIYGRGLLEQETSGVSGVGRERIYRQRTSFRERESLRGGICGTELHFVGNIIFTGRTNSRLNLLNLSENILVVRSLKNFARNT